MVTHTVLESYLSSMIYKHEIIFFCFLELWCCCFPSLWFNHTEFSYILLGIILTWSQHCWIIPFRLSCTVLYYTSILNSRVCEENTGMCTHIYKGLFLKIFKFELSYVKDKKLKEFFSPYSWVPAGKKIVPKIDQKKTTRVLWEPQRTGTGWLFQSSTPHGHHLHAHFQRCPLLHKHSSGHWRWKTFAPHFPWIFPVYTPRSTHYMPGTVGGYAKKWHWIKFPDAWSMEGAPQDHIWALI